MPDPTDSLNEDCEIASDLKQLMLEGLGDDIELDEATLGALMRGIISLLQSL